MIATADDEFWDHIAEKYAERPVDDVPAWERKQAITKEHLEPHHMVLDVGCGTGSLALIMAPHCDEVHALDISEEMCRIGREKAAKAGVQNVTFHQTAVEEAGFEPESFDGICAYSILHLVRDLRGTLDTLFTLLKPGGYFISSTVCLGGSLVPYRPILAVMRAFGKAPRVTILRRDALLEAMRAAGFVDVTLTDVGAQKKSVVFVVARKP